MPHPQICFLCRVAEFQVPSLTHVLRQHFQKRVFAKQIFCVIKCIQEIWVKESFCTGWAFQSHGWLVKTAISSASCFANLFDPGVLSSVNMFGYRGLPWMRALNQGVWRWSLGAQAFRGLCSPFLFPVSNCVVFHKRIPTDHVSCFCC